MPAEFSRHRTLLLCLGLVITLTLPLKAATQEAERVVEKTSRRPTPLKIRVVKTKKGEVMLGKKFVDSDEDWFKGLSIVLENVSDKTVTYVGVGLLFPRQPGDEGKPPLYWDLRYGVHPEAPESVAARTQPLALRPGEEIVVTLPDPDYSEVRGALSQLEYQHSIKAIKLHLAELYFEDGSGWVVGTWLPPHAIKPRSAIRERRPPDLTRRASFLNCGLRENAPASLPAVFFSKPWQETCTVQSEPARGALGECGKHDGFYSRR